MTKLIKKIGIDCRSMGIGGGVKTYLINFLNRIGEIDQYNQYVLYYDSEINLGTFLFKNFQEVVIPNRFRFLIPYWEQIRLRNRIVKDQIDVFHGTKNTVSIFLPKRIKVVITIHDMTPFKFTHEMSYFDLIYWRIFIPLSLRVSNRIIAISETTKNDLIKQFPESRNKLDVIYLGHDCKKTGNDCKKDYFLVVGAIRQRKNLERILIALSKLSDKEINIYIVGKDLKYSDRIMSLVHRLNICERAVFRGYVSDDELNQLYSKAVCCLYPSLYEGFGLPILEAQAHGLPVITSNISSMPEVAGDGAILVDPYNIDDIKNAMELIIGDENLRKQLINKGYRNLDRFSWKKCAEETVKVYNEICED